MENILKSLNELTNPYNNEKFDAKYYVKNITIDENKVELHLIYPGLDTEKNNLIKREITKVVKIDLAYDGIKIIESKNNLGDDTKLIAILSGKGGVGKSNAVVNLAKSMTRLGKKVGIIDCDIYGYSIPKILNMYETPQIINNRIQPLKTEDGIEIMSTQYFIENNENKAVVWRGPVLRQVMDNFFLSTDFSKDLDYIFIDMPPGTGDIMLNLKDYVTTLDSILVTTPSLDASHVAVRCGELAKKLDFGLLGVIENMAYYEHNGEKLYIFGNEGYDEIAKELIIPLLGEVPITKDVDLAYDKMAKDLEAMYAKR